MRSSDVDSFRVHLRRTAEGCRTDSRDVKAGVRGCGRLLAVPSIFTTDEQAAAAFPPGSASDRLVAGAPAMASAVLQAPIQAAAMGEDPLISMLRAVEAGALGNPDRHVEEVPPSPGGPWGDGVPAPALPTWPTEGAWRDVDAGTPQDPLIRTNNIYAYSVLCEQRGIVVHTESDSLPKAYTDLRFTGVLAHHFANVLAGNVLVGIEEVDPQSIVQQWAEVFAAGKPHAWPPVEYGHPDELVSILRDRGIKGFRLDAFYGLGGWVLAESMALGVRAARAAPGW